MFARGTLHYHKYLRLDGRRSSQYKFESRVEGEKKKKEKRKMPFYRVSNFYVFQTSSGGVGVDRWIRDIERERLR